jgi:hypothetical protein
MDAHRLGQLVRLPHHGLAPLTRVDGRARETGTEEGAVRAPTIVAPDRGRPSRQDLLASLAHDDLEVVGRPLAPDRQQFLRPWQRHLEARHDRAGVGVAVTAGPAHLDVLAVMGAVHRGPGLPQADGQEEATQANRSVLEQLAPRWSRHSSVHPLAPPLG